MASVLNAKEIAIATASMFASKEAKGRALPVVADQLVQLWDQGQIHDVEAWKKIGFAPENKDNRPYSDLTFKMALDVEAYLRTYAQAQEALKGGRRGLAPEHEAVLKTEERVLSVFKNRFGENLSSAGKVARLVTAARFFYDFRGEEGGTAPSPKFLFREDMFQAAVSKYRAEVDKKLSGLPAAADELVRQSIPGAITHPDLGMQALQRILAAGVKLKTS